MYVIIILMWKKLEAYWLASYESLHIPAYWLIGKRYQYHGVSGPIVAREPLTRRQHLFCLLFPLIVISCMSMALLLVWFYTYVRFLSSIDPQAYYRTAPLWHIGLQVSAVLLLLFISPAYFDIHRAIKAKSV